MNQGIDIHTHVVPEHFPAYIGSNTNVPWPSMDHSGCGHAHVVISSKNYRTVVEAAWSAEKRIVDMDGMALARQVLSPMPELLSYWLPSADGSVLCRWMNETIANMVNQHPDRFSGLGAVPLQDIDAAIAELDYLMNTLHLSGVEIATHINGASIGDPRFEPFFAAAERMGAAIFVHGLKPAGSDRLVGPPALEQIVAFPGDVALAAASMITGGVMERHPALRIAFSHGCGSFPTILPRLQHGWKTIPMLKEGIAVSPAETARKFYCDSLTYDADVLRLALRTFGNDKVMIGTDYPFPVKDTDPHGTITALHLSELDATALRQGNAERFLNL